MSSLNLIPGSQVTADALSAQKLRIDLIAQNIANANTTRDADGLPYQRKMATFESYLIDASVGEGSFLGTSVRVGDIAKDPTPGETIYNPHHPHANDEGFVLMPNVSTAKEMVDFIAASNAYKANLSVAKNSKQLSQEALSIGK